MAHTHSNRGGLTDAMDTHLGNLQGMVRDREAWCATVQGVAKSRTQLGDRTTIWALKRGVRVLVFNLSCESISLSRPWSPNLLPAGTSCTISPQAEPVAQPRGGGAKTDGVDRRPGGSNVPLGDKGLGKRLEFGKPSSPSLPSAQGVVKMLL